MSSQPQAVQSPTVIDANEAMARTNIALVQKAMTEFDSISHGIGEMSTKYSGVVFDVTTAAGIKEASTARAEIREPRFKTEHARKAAKAPLLELGRNIDQRAAFITEELMKLETPIDDQIKAEERRKEDERIAAARVISERITATRNRIDTMQRLPLDMLDASAAELQGAVDAMAAAEITDEHYRDFLDEAGRVKAATLAQLQSMITAKKATEAEALRLKAEREDLERKQSEESARIAAERDKLARQQAELAQAQRVAEERINAEALAAQRRLAQDEADSRRRREDADRAARVARETEEAAAKEIRDAEEARLRADRAKIDAEARVLAEEQRIAEERAALKAEQDERDRIAREAREAEEHRIRVEKYEAERVVEAERERKEAEAREAQRLADELLDAAAMLATFRERFGHIRKYARVVKAIDAVQASKEEKA